MGEFKIIKIAAPSPEKMPCEYCFTIRPSTRMLISVEKEKLIAIYGTSCEEHLTKLEKLRANA